MTRNLKAIGLALIAVLAFSGLIAAQAGAHKFEATTYPTVLTGEKDPTEGLPNEKFTTAAGGVVECKKSKYVGTVEQAGAETVTVHPTYSECTAPGIGAATVRTNHCNFHLLGATDANGHAQSEMKCEVGTERIEVEIAAVGCTLKFAPQKAGKGVHYTNVKTTFEEITLHQTATEIKYEKSGSAFGCALVPGNGSDGELHGTTTIKGFEDKSPGLGTEFTPAPTEGTQVNIRMVP